MFENEFIKVVVSGYGPRVWNKYGKVRIYFDTDDLHFVDLTELASGNLNADMQSTYIKQYDYDGEYDHQAKRWRWLKWKHYKTDVTVRVKIK